MTKLCDFKRNNLTVLTWLKYLLIVKREEHVTNCTTKFLLHQSITNLYFQYHIKCSKCPPFACMHAFRRFVKSLTAFLIGSCGTSSHIDCKASFSSAIIFGFGFSNPAWLPTRQCAVIAFQLVPSFFVFFE